MQEFNEVREFVGRFINITPGGIAVLMMWENAEKSVIPSEEDKRRVMVADRIYKRVKLQVRHLASICEEPIPDPSKMTAEEEQGLSDDIAFGRRDEQVAARVNLVLLHTPEPAGLSQEEYEEWLDEQHEQNRNTFVPLNDMTVGELLDYLEYWQQEREGVEAMKWFGDEMRIAQVVAEITGDDVPQNVGEYFEYLDKRAQEEEE